MSAAVQEALAKARAGGKKASAKDAAPAVPVVPVEVPAPLVTASSALPAHEIDVVHPVDPITAAVAETATNIIDAVGATEPIRDTPAVAYETETVGVQVNHVALVEDKSQGWVVPLGEEVTTEVGGEQVSGVLTDVVRLESPLESDGYDGDREDASDSYGYGWDDHEEPDEAVTAPAGDVHPGFAKLPPAGMDVPVYRA